MAKERVTVTIDADLLAEAQRRLGEESLSAFVNEALRRKLQSERLGELLDELEAKHGPIPPEVQKEVDELWDRVSFSTPEQ